MQHDPIVPPRAVPARPATHQAAPLNTLARRVEVLALTTDEDLIEALREATGEDQRVWHTTTAEQAIDLVMSGHVGVVVIDTMITGADSAGFCERLRSQFPDLVLVAAGGTEDQSLIVKQITSGDIYRFLHKPVSVARARQFVEAGVRRHLEERSTAPATALDTGPSSNSSPPKMAVILGFSAFAIAVAVGMIWLLGGAPDGDKQTARIATTGARTTPIQRAPVVRLSPASQAAAAHESPAAAILSAIPNDSLQQREVIQAKPTGAARQSTNLLLQQTESALRASRLELEVAREEAARARQELAAVKQAAPATIDAASAGAVTANGAAASPLSPVSTTASVQPAASIESSSPSVAVAVKEQAPSQNQTEDLLAARNTIPAATPTSAVERKSGSSEPLPAVSLGIVKQIDPLYPSTALRKNIEGWTEIEFTVTPAGTVKDITLTGAAPAGVFDAAARDAIARWKFKPRGNEQRARVRLRFEIAK